MGKKQLAGCGLMIAVPVANRQMKDDGSSTAHGSPVALLPRSTANQRDSLHEASLVAYRYSISLLRVRSVGLFYFHHMGWE
jgi:hypothetical protein